MDAGDSGSASSDAAHENDGTAGDADADTDGDACDAVSVGVARVTPDMLIVLDNGECMEVGSPAELLAKPAGVFASMVEQTGSAEMLRKRAGGQHSPARPATPPQVPWGQAPL